MCTNKITVRWKKLYDKYIKQDLHNNSYIFSVIIPIQSNNIKSILLKGQSFSIRPSAHFRTQFRTKIWKKQSENDNKKEANSVESGAYTKKY